MECKHPTAWNEFEKGLIDEVITSSGIAFLLVHVVIHVGLAVNVARSRNRGKLSCVGSFSMVY